MEEARNSISPKPQEKMEQGGGGGKNLNIFAKIKT